MINSLLIVVMSLAAFIAVMCVSFAMTTLDSATRLLRYNIEEVGQSFSKGGVKRALGNRFVASGLAVWLTVESVLSFKREKSRS